MPRYLSGLERPWRFYGTINDPGRCQRMTPQSSDERLGFPMAMGDIVNKAFALGCPTYLLGQLGIR